MINRTPIRCPLPGVEMVHSDDGSHPVVRPCGGELYVRHDRRDGLYADGAYEGSDCWSVGCDNGHVLVVPLHDGDPYDLDRRTVAEALVSLGVEGAHPELDPMP